MDEFFEVPINLSHYTVKTLDDVEQIRSAVVRCLSPLERKVYAIVNYDGFVITHPFIDARGSIKSVA